MGRDLWPDAAFATGPVDDWDGESQPESVWGPLEAVARLSQQSSALPTLSADDFMYMDRVCDPATGVVIHLYKHIDTRRYLNLDDAGHAYAYAGGEETPDGSYRGHYRRYRSLADAIEHVELSLLDEGFFRSYPPKGWEQPADHAW
jgi:hypothetical protein